MHPKIAALLLKAATLLLLGHAQLAEAQDLLRIDFGKSTPPPSPVQSGFVAFGISLHPDLGPVSKFYAGRNEAWTKEGWISVTLAAGASLSDTKNLLSRDRESNEMHNESFTHNALYRDLIIAHNRQRMFIGIAGLKPNTAYDIRLYSYDSSEDGASVFTNATGTGSESATISWSKDHHMLGAVGTVFSALLRLKTDAKGKLVISNNRSLSSNVNRQAIINGLEITAVP